MANDKIPLSEILVKNSTYQSNKLRKRLIKEGIKLPFCDSCSGYYWLGQPIPLELNHKNGDNSDNTLENLEFLCPNCHALTPSYRGKNAGKATNKHHYATVAERHTHST